MARLLGDAMALGRVGAVDLAARRGHSRPAGAVPGRRRRRGRRPARRARAQPVAGSSRSCPDCSVAADPRIMMEDLARRCGARHIPLTWTGFTYSDSNPAYTEGWLDLTRRLQADGIAFYPQQSPRTVDFRLNWDSSMMFMSMPAGWHKVIAAVGDDAKAALLARSGLAGHRPRGVGPGRQGHLPPPPAGEGALRRGPWRRQPALARPHAGRPGRRARRPPLRRAGRLRPRQRLPAGAGRHGRRQRRYRRGEQDAGRSRRAGQLVGRRSPYADAVRLRRQHAPAHPPRARAGRLHARGGGARADRAAVRSLRLHRPRRARSRATPPTWSCSRSTSCTTTWTSSCPTCPAAVRGCAGPKAATGPPSSTASPSRSRASSPASFPAGSSPPTSSPHTAQGACPARGRPDRRVGDCRRSR